MNSEDILIRYAYSEYTKPKIDSDPNDYIEGELTQISPPFENRQKIDGTEYNITLYECRYKLDSENVSKKSISVNNYLNHYDEVGPIRGWIHLDINSKYRKQRDKWKLNQHNCTHNVITTFGDSRYSQAFIFTKYKKIVESLQQDQKIEKITPTLETNIEYKSNVLQIGNFGSLMPSDKMNTCEVNFIGKIEFPVFELRIFSLDDKLIKDQKIYDLFIKDFYAASSATTVNIKRKYESNSISSISKRTKAKGKKRITKPKLKIKPKSKTKPKTKSKPKTKTKLKPKTESESKPKTKTKLKPKPK